MLFMHMLSPIAAAAAAAVESDEDKENVKAEEAEDELAALFGVLAAPCRRNRQHERHWQPQRSDHKATKQRHSRPTTRSSSIH